MAERDVKVVYRSRDIPDDYQSRVPTALDPYDYPRDGRSVRRARSVRKYNDNSTSVSDSGSTIRTPRSVKSTYTVDDERGSREAYVDVEKSTYRDRSRPRSVRTTVGDTDSTNRRSFVLDNESDRRHSRQATSNFGSSPQRSSRGRLDVNYDRAQSRSREYILDDSVNRSHDSFRRDGRSYVMDTQGEVDVIMPGREHERSRDGRGPRYVYADQPSRNEKSYGRDVYEDDERLPDGVVLVSRDIIPPSRYHQSQMKSDQDSRMHSSRREYDRDDDWRIIDSMRDTTLSSPEQRRSRAATRSSEDSFVMVPAGYDSRPAVRSAMRHTDYEPAELTRRRSRSISFRESETLSHDVGDRRHERPGAEADICGPYLKRRSERDSEVDTNSYVSSRPVSRHRHSRRSEVDRSDDDRYREPYSPQMDTLPRKRERSRRRRREDEDDASYYSERVDKKYVKETRYL